MPPGRLPVLMTGGISRATCLPRGHSRAYFFFFCFLRWKQQCKPEYGPQQAPDYKPPPPPLRTPPRSGSGGLEAGGLYTPDEGLPLGRAHSLACSITVMVTASKYPSLASSSFNMQGLRGERTLVFPRLPASPPGPIPGYRPPRPASVPSNPAGGGHPGGHFHA